MTQKKYIFILGILVALILIFMGILLSYHKATPTPDVTTQKYHIATKPTQTYRIEDTSNSPQSPEAVTYGEIIRETDATNTTALQRFVVKSSIDGTSRELFEVNESDITFEKIAQENWSPSNRFLFIYIDYPTRRDVIFLKTDGKFTNGQYYLHSTGLYPDMNVLSARWIDEAALELKTQNSKTQVLENYKVNFDDDTGIVMPETK